jgi:hypothetical protein
MRIEDEIVREIKPVIESGNVGTLEILWEDYQHTDFGRPIAWDYIFQHVYLHAALKKKHEFCEWFDAMFLEFDPVIQIALRQLFPYARMLLEH